MTDAGRGETSRSTSCGSWRARYGDEVAYRDLDAGTAITFAEWDAAVEPARPRPRRRRDRARRPGRRSTCPSDEALRWIVAYAAVHKAGAVVVPPTPASRSPRSSRSSATPRSSAIITCDVAARHALAVRTAVPSIRFVVSAGGGRSTAASATTTTFLADDASDIQVPRSARRPRRHHVHVGYDRPPQGRRGPAPQRRDDPEPRTDLDRRAAGSTARRCSRSPASRSSTTR